MAIKYGFFNSIGGDRKYNADDIGRYLMGMVSSGVYAEKATSLQVLAADGMRVEVQPGRAMLDYHYMENDSPLTLTLDNGGTQDRVDAIVARLDMNNRLCTIAVKKGTEAAKPSAPAMERTDTVKEYMLASVYIAKLSSSVTQSNITDTRADKTVCGWVTGLIDNGDGQTEIPITSEVPADSNIWLDPNDDPDEDDSKPMYASACGSSASLSLPSGEIVKVNLDTWNVRSDTSFAFSGGGIKMPAAGTVLVSASIYHTGPLQAESHTVGAYIYKNGVEIGGTLQNKTVQSSVCVSAFLATVAAGDILTLHARDRYAAGSCIPSNIGTALNVVYL